MNTDMPKINQEIVDRLQNATAELSALEDAIKSGNIDPAVLTEFRQAVDNIRQTAWAVQEWLHRQSQRRDPSALLSLLTLTRIRRAARMNSELIADLETGPAGLDSDNLRNLHQATERLVQHLSRYAGD